MIFHRGMMYLATETRDEKSVGHVALTGYSMEDPKKEPEILYEAVNENSSNGLRGLTAYGNRLYFYRPEADTDRRELCILDLRTREVTVVPPPDDTKGPLSMTFQGGKLLLDCPIIHEEDGSNEKRLYRCDPDGSHMELLSDRAAMYAADEQYIYLTPYYFTEGREDDCIHICDPAMNELDCIDLSELGDPASFSSVNCFPVNSDQVFLILRVREADGVVFHYYWFSKSEIGSGNIEPHPFFDEGNNEYSIVKIDKAGSGVDPHRETTAAAATTTAASVAAGPSVPVTTAPVRTSTARWDTGSITVEDLGLDLEDKAVEFLCSVPGEGFDERLGAWEKAAQYISETYMGDVTLTPLTYTDYLQTLRKRQAAGDAPDVFPVENVSGKKLSELVQKGQVLPLDAYVDACMPHSYARVDERLYDMVRFGGNIYGILSLSEELLPTQTLYYDKSMTDAAGIAVGDWTRMSDNWDMFYKMREWLDANRPELWDTPVAAVDITWANEGLFELFGGEFSCAGAMYPGYETDGAAASEVLNIYETQGFCEYLLNLRQLKIDRILPEDWTFMPQDEQKAAYSGAEGVVFLSEPAGTGGNWAKSIQSAAFCSTESVTGPALVVSADSKAPDAACKLIEILNCDKYAGTCLRLGEEGADWTMNADGQAVIRRDLGMWGSGMLGDVTNCVIPATEAADYRAQLEARMANAAVSENLGFRLDEKCMISGYALSFWLTSFHKDVLKDYLGMGSGQELYKGERGEEPAFIGYDIHIGYLLECTLSSEELEKQYQAFTARMHNKDAYYESKPICAEVQRQLDAWRAGR